VDEDNTVSTHDSKPPALDNQDKAITGVENEQSMEKHKTTYNQFPKKKMTQTNI